MLVKKFVSEHPPKHIGVNYIYDLGVASSSEEDPLTDGISYKDYNLLIEALGENYAVRVRSAEYVIMDYLAGRVKEEIKLYAETSATLSSSFNSSDPASDIFSSDLFTLTSSDTGEDSVSSGLSSSFFS